MATNVSDLLAQEQGKNSGLTSNGSNISAIINQSNSAVIASAQAQQSGVADLEREQREALAARQNAARVAFDTVQKQQSVLAEELAAVNVRTAQTQQMQEVLRAEQNKKAEDIAKATIEVNNTSFFSNPIAWFTSRSRLSDAKGDLAKTSDALVQVHNVIDDEYAAASKNFRTFQTSKTMIAMRQAELDAKLSAEKESLDVSMAAQKAEADNKSLQILATQMKVDPLALKEAELKITEKYAIREENRRGAKGEKDVYGVEALMAAYNMDTTNPNTRMQAATVLHNMPPEEKNTWNSIQLALLSSGKPMNATSVMEEFKKRDDVNGYLKVLEASDPEIHGELLRGVQESALGGEEAKKRKEALVKELTDINLTAEGKAKLTPQQIEAKAAKTLVDQVYGSGINAVLAAGTAVVRGKISAIGAKAPAETLDGNAIAVWAEQVPGLEAKTVEALKSPNVILAYDTGHKVGDRLSALDPQGSRVISGVEKLVAMGVSEEQAVKAYSAIMKRAAEGYIRAIPEGGYLLDRYKKLGIEIPLSNPVPSIDLNFSIFGGYGVEADRTKILDLFNPVDLQNYLERVRQTTKSAETFNSAPRSSFSPGLSL